MRENEVKLDGKLITKEELEEKKKFKQNLMHYLMMKDIHKLKIG